MNRKAKVGIALAVVACLAGGVLLLSKHRAGARVTVTLQISVAPSERSDFVVGQANSARFKYLMGKQAGVTPVLAQKLTVKPMRNSPHLEARICVQTKDEGQRYADVFVETLQYLCGGQAQVALADQSIR